MDSLKEAKIKKIAEILSSWPVWSPRMSAEFLIDKLEEVELNEQVRFDELNVIEQRQNYEQAS